MAEHNIVVFGGDHCGPEVRLPSLGGETETARLTTDYANRGDFCCRSLSKVSRYVTQLLYLFIFTCH